MNTMHQTLLNVRDRAMNRKDQVPELVRVYILMKEENKQDNYKLQCTFKETDD